MARDSLNKFKSDYEVYCEFVEFILNNIDKDYDKMIDEKLKTVKDKSLLFRYVKIKEYISEYYDDIFSDYDRDFYEDKTDEEIDNMKGLTKREKENIKYIKHLFDSNYSSIIDNERIKFDKNVYEEIYENLCLKKSKNIDEITKAFLVRNFKDINYYDLSINNSNAKVEIENDNAAKITFFNFSDRYDDRHDNCIVGITDAKKVVNIVDEYNDNIKSLINDLKNEFCIDKQN